MRRSRNFACRTQNLAESTVINPRGRCVWKSIAQEKYPFGPRVFTHDVEEPGPRDFRKACCQEHELLRLGDVCSVCSRHSLSGKLENIRGSFGVCFWSYGWGYGERPHECEEMLLTLDDKAQGQSILVNTNTRVLGWVVHPTLRYESRSWLRHAVNGDGFLMREHTESRITGEPIPNLVGLSGDGHYGPWYHRREQPEET